jgi:signal transduction histidine kinase
MFAETLQMHDSTDPRIQREFLNTIVHESERLTRLLNNVLDFSRIERGQRNYHRVPTPLADVVRSAARTMQFPLSEQGFDFQVDVCDGLPLIRLDRDALEQAILNLLSNAMKYSGASRVIALTLRSEDASALIQVVDHGIGIAPEERKRIFETFYRIASPENRAISGTGLGLALIAHITEGHGGAVEVVSTPGEGSTFSIRIPFNGNGHS